MFDFNKCLDYIVILEETGAETLVFNDYQIGIDKECIYYLDMPLFDSNGEFVGWRNIVEHHVKTEFAKYVADYFLGVEDK